MSRLQLVQIVAAILLVNIIKRVHMTPVPAAGHWLSVRTDFSKAHVLKGACIISQILQLMNGKVLNIKSCSFSPCRSWNCENYNNHLTDSQWSVSLTDMADNVHWDASISIRRQTQDSGKKTHCTFAGYSSMIFTRSWHRCRRVLVVASALRLAWNKITTHEVIRTFCGPQSREPSLAGDNSDVIQQAKTFNTSYIILWFELQDSLINTSR